MRKNLIAVGVVFLIALALVGLTFSTTVEERADYILINGTEPKTLDPAKATGQPEGRILEAIFEGLTFRDPKTLQPVPGAAESWDISPDGRKYVFKMRPGIKWHNGDPLTAHDFVYSWRRFLDPQIASEYAYLLYMIPHAEVYNSYLGHVEAIRGSVKRYGEGTKYGEVVFGADGSPQFDSGGILARLAQLQEVIANEGPRPAKEWQKFLDEAKVTSSVPGITHEGVLELLGRTEGTVSSADIDAFAAGLEVEAGPRLEKWLASTARIGVDEGFWASEDGTEFHVQLVRYAPYFMHLTCFYPLFPVNERVVRASPNSWFLPETMVGNGPFKMLYWRVNQKIRLVRNDEHWDAKQVALRHVDMLSLENRTTQMNLFLTNEADWAPTGYPPDLIDVVKKKPYYYANRGFIIYWYRINVTKPYLKDPRVRQALATGFSRHVICNEVLRKGDIPSASLVPPGVAGYVSPKSFIDLEDDATPGMPKQIARANRLLDEAGFAELDGDGYRKGIPELGILHNTDEGHKKVAEYIAQQWGKNLKIRAVPINKEWQSYLASQRKLDYDVSRAGWIGDYLDPNTFLDMWVTNGGNNQTGWGDPRYDRLINYSADMDAFARDPEPVLADAREPEALREGLRRLADAGDDLKKRIVELDRLRFLLFREAEAMLIQEQFPIVPIYSYQVSGLVRGDVEGFYSRLVNEAGEEIGDNLQDLHPFRYVRTGRTPRAED